MPRKHRDLVKFLSRDQVRACWRQPIIRIITQ